MALDNTIELARWFDDKGNIKIVTIKQYQDLIAANDKVRIAEFIYNRLYSRYLKQFFYAKSDYKKQYKNGFSIMANCCLLIETLQSFKNGWDDSDRKSAAAFTQFLTTEKNFNVLSNRAREFYSNVRCGILHQGETTGGWRIKRIGANLFDNTNLTIDSVKFAKELNSSLQKYSKDLENSAWDDEIWDNFRTKMRKIIANCER